MTMARDMSVRIGTGIPPSPTYCLITVSLFYTVRDGNKLHMKLIKSVWHILPC